MASLICTLSFNCSSSSLSYVKFTKPAMNSLTSCHCSSNSLTLHLKTLNLPLLTGFSHVGLSQFTPWYGLKHLGIKISPKVAIFGRRERCKGKVVHASLFGVGAPEALVIGVVALLVFGPKGLAEVARNLGKTLRAFQPTIRELQEVSREFKSTLEREISLDDDISLTSNTYESNRANTLNQSVSSTENPQTSVADPNGTTSNNAYSSEEYLKITEEQLKAYSATQENATASSPPESQIELGTQLQDSNAPNGVYSSEDNLKDNFTTSLLESQAEMESQLQDTIQEATVTPSPPIEKPESET